MFLIKIKFFSTLIIISLLASTSFANKKNKANLEKITRQIEEKRTHAKKIETQSRKLKSEITETQRKMVTIANNVKKYERELSTYDKQITNLQTQEKNLNQKLGNNNEDLVKTISIFQKISTVPNAYLFISQTRADNMFNASILLRSLLSNLNKSKLSFEADLMELTKLKTEIIRAKQNVFSVNNKVKVEKDKITTLIKNKQKSYKQLESENIKAKREINKLINESKTIEDFLKKAEKLRIKKETERKNFGLSTSRPLRLFIGSAPLPVEGEIKTYFGENKIGGVKAKGLYIKAHPNAQVISPVDGDVVFAGNFYGYKNLLILHSTDNYYIIMGGMDEVFVAEGQSLLAGEPVGQMANADFYVEIRQNEKPMNPAKYFKI